MNWLEYLTLGLMAWTNLMLTVTLVAMWWQR